MPKVGTMPRGEKSGDSGYTAVPVHSKEDVMQDAITGYHMDEPKVPEAVTEVLCGGLRPE